jgi:hypothetical protein
MHVKLPAILLLLAGGCATAPTPSLAVPSAVAEPHDHAAHLAAEAKAVETKPALQGGHTCPCMAKQQTPQAGEHQH